MTPAARRLAAVQQPSLRGLGLIRVSKAKGREDLVSPDIQRSAITLQAERENIAIVGWREVLDESASQDRSRWWVTLDEAVSLVEAGEVDRVLVWKLSRAARHRRRWAVALDRIEVAGGQVLSATEDIDGTTSTGRLARGVLAELAAWESDVKGEQWKEAHAQRLAAGLPHAGRPRFGYLYEKGKGYRPDTAEARREVDLDPHGATAPVLVEVYERFTRGESARSICQWLNRAGIRTTRGSEWVAVVLYRVLDAGFGAGLLHVKSTGEHRRGAHEPIISPELWEAFQQTRESGRRHAPWNRSPAHDLTGIIKCGHCKRPMHAGAVKEPNGSRRPIYRCSANASGRLCTGASITASVAEKAVRVWVEQLNDELDGDLDAAARTAAARVEVATAVRLDQAHWQRLVERYDRQLAQLNVDRAEGLMPDTAAFVSARDEITGRRDEAREQLHDTVEELQHVASDHRPVIRGLANDWDAMDVQGRRGLLKQLLSAVHVHRRDSDQHRLQYLPTWERTPTV